MSLPRRAPAPSCIAALACQLAQWEAWTARRWGRSMVISIDSRRALELHGAMGPTPRMKRPSALGIGVHPTLNHLGAPLPGRINEVRAGVNSHLAW